MFFLSSIETHLLKEHGRRPTEETFNVINDRIFCNLRRQPLFNLFQILVTFDLFSGFRRNWCLSIARIQQVDTLHIFAGCCTKQVADQCSPMFKRTQKRYECNFLLRVLYLCLDLNLILALMYAYGYYPSPLSLSYGTLRYIDNCQSQINVTVAAFASPRDTPTMRAK